MKLKNMIKPKPRTIGDEMSPSRHRPTFRVLQALLVILIVGVGLGPASAIAGGGGENVVLVINADSASSKMLGNYYIQGRQIPSRNVIYLNGVPDREVAGWKVFRNSVLEPLLAEMNRRGLTGHADYIIYSSDFPTVVDVAAHHQKLLPRLKANAGQKIPARVFNGNASLTSLTYFLGAAMADEPGYMLLESNNYYRKPAEVLLRKPFLGDQQKLFESAIEKINSESPDELQAAIKTLVEIGNKNPKQLAVHYWLAKFHAKQGNAKEATAWLTRAVRLGWCYQKQTLADLAFEKVKDDPLFQGIVDRIPNQPFEFVPTHGFKGRFAWGPNGMLNDEPGQGNRHFLSSILSVTRNEGISESKALEQIQTSILADETYPQGTFYFTQTKNVRSTTRQPNFGVAIEQLTAMGFNAEIVERPIPSKARDIVGLTCGVASFNWVASGSKIIPGAFCDNLTSFGGVFRRPGQTKCTEFLARGAAGASGTVIEPYAIQAKFPHPMIHVHYARGCSLAESFYQSVQGPFQTLLVGDALCQPWAKKPVLKVSGIEPGATISGKQTMVLDASTSPVSVAGIEFYVDGIPVFNIPMEESLTLDTSDMADGYHEIRLVANTRSPIQTTATVVIPIVVDNQGDSVVLTTEHADYLDTDQIKFQATATTGDSIELMQNGRAIAKKIGKDVTFEVDGALLGRGPVTLTAVSISESDEQTIGSEPLRLTIEGRIAEVVRRTEPIPRKKTAPKTRK